MHKLILSLMSLTLISSPVGAVIETSKKVQINSLLDGPDVTSVMDKTILKIERALSYNPTDTKKLPDNELVDLLTTSMAILNDLVLEDNFYKYQDKFINYIHYYKVRLEKLSILDGQNLYDYSMSWYNDQMVRFNNQVQEGLQNDFLEFNIAKNKELFYLRNFVESKFNKIVADISINNKTIAEIEAENAVLIAENAANNERIKILKTILEVNSRARAMFMEYYNMFFDLYNYMENGYSSAEWHSENYEMAWIPIYGIFYVKNFRNAMDVVMKGIAGFVNILDVNSDGLNEVFKSYDNKLTSYVEDIVADSGESSLVDDMFEYFEIKDKVNNQFKGAEKLQKVVVKGLDYSVLGGILSFLQDLFAPAFAAKKLHDAFNGLIADSRSTLKSNIEPNLDKLSTNKEAFEDLEKKDLALISELSVGINGNWKKLRKTIRKSMN
ncbi:hypothetical protein SCLARK_00529 [Spiroplasma clarkii]|uniref:hypothetical protein n=1 Tax=Spiroplasma clarkii TaxID=2139 RepID=UPI000B577414|nr:hypothetical protein [Spiroplasma clarkii]ARU91217.1 hypothetical protein SCLARK_00529 [Spiroplasma clarkii]